MNYRELLAQYTDMALLTIAPKPGERDGWISSYDRSSTYGPVENKYRHWDANDDGNG